MTTTGAVNEQEVAETLLLLVKDHQDGEWQEADGEEESQACRAESSKSKHWDNDRQTYCV